MHQDFSEDEIELEKSIRRLREMFHTRGIPVQTAESLMRRYNNDYNLVTEEIMRLRDQEDDAEVGAEDQSTSDTVTSSEGDDDSDLQEIVDRLRTLPLTEENVRMFDSATRNEIPCSPRQFACLHCDRDWWREVPDRKMVSRCRRCKRTFEAVPRDKEWGVAEYNCLNCNHSFKSFGQMGLPAPCYRCRSVVLPIQIIPSKRDPRRPGNERRNSHSCCAEDCWNRQEPYVPGTHCVHPRTRSVRGLPKALCPSQSHENTGSTVASCISQSSSMECDIERIILEDLNVIAEEDEDE
ncbi:shiftless antiviral inhibitor of ribosomal frameshifting protein homolog isoform X1 [Heterodontus francisci]|uniref:shiftless antiviral inhibitor of ribosomal frameshifting protein homolog isoform X1 n=1 Tax=Heterodontus francisci TaxID=7792 RepID=UPI00355C74E4